MNISFLIERFLMLGVLSASIQAPLWAQQSELSSKEPSPSHAITELSLPPRWNSSLGSGIEAMRELLGVLSPFCHPDGSIEIKEFPEIKNGVTLMMPLNEALAKLQISQLIPAKQAIVFPGIPFYYRIFTNPRRDGFNLVYVITDGADRVVGLQYVNETPKEGGYGQSSEHVPKNNLTYNFINSRKRATRTLEVQTAVATRGDGNALPISNYLDRVNERSLRNDEKTARTENRRETSLRQTEEQLESIKQRLAHSEKQLEQMRKSLAELQKANSPAAPRLEQDILNKETLIFNDTDLLKRVQQRYDNLINRSSPTKAPANIEADPQEILCIQTTLFDQKRFRTLEIVNWYLPRSIASFIHQNILTQLGVSADKPR